ncbi:MAG: DUF4230 domain-containing protein [Actinomycetota bacterium]
MPVMTRERAGGHRPGPGRDGGSERRSWRPLAVVAVVLALVFGAGQLLDLLPSLHNPFTTETVDRTQPAVLKAIEDLSRYEAASGSFQVIVDLEQDARFLPDFIRGEHTLFVAGGTVAASVDFSGLAGSAIVVSPDGDEVTVALPRARLSDARIDPGASRVVSRQRGLLDRIGGVFSDNPTGERELYVLAEQKLEAAARAGDLRARAEKNTAAMLKAMLGTLGFEKVTVTFGDAAA